MKKNNIGISLISLIIIIIVIIILAAIVIFTGLGTPDQANFARFAQEFSDFDLAVTNDYAERYTNNVLLNKTRSKAQIYYEIASGVDVGQNGDPEEVDTIQNLGLNILPEGLRGKEYYEIVEDKNIKNWKKESQYYEAVEKHYVTDEGDVFFLPGYPMEEDDGTIKWWISENKYYVSAEPIRGAASIEVDNIKITTDVAGGIEAGENLINGTTLYINFEASEDRASVTVSPSLPYAITTNGKYSFTLTSSSGKTKTYIVTVSNFKEPTLAEKLEIGHYVEYTPVTATTTYITNPAGNKALYTGYSSQKIEQETNLTWRVIKVDKSTGEVLITPTDAVNIGTYLGGAQGYLNHKNILDDICKTLYSNSELGVTARSMKLEDLDYTVSDSTIRYAYYPYGVTITSEMDVTYNEAEYTATAHTSSNYAFLEYDHIYNSGEQIKTYTESVTIDGSTYNYTYNYAKPISVVEADGSTKYYPVLVSGKRASISAGTNTSAAIACIGNKADWLASSYIDSNGSYSYFRVYGAKVNGNSFNYLANSSGGTRSVSRGIRPVVTLGSTLQVDISDTSRDGSSSMTAWKIIKK